MTNCQRCEKETFGTIMSMYSTAIIRMDCKDADWPGVHPNG